MDLFEAIQDHDKRISELIRKCKNIDIKNDEGQTLLHIAVGYENLDATRALISEGINVNASDSDGLTSLHYIAENRNSTISSTYANMLLEAGAQLSIANKHENTPLWTAVFNARGIYSLVNLFIRYGGLQFAETKNKYGRSPLDFARQISDERLVQILMGKESPEAIQET